MSTKAIATPAAPAPATKPANAKGPQPAPPGETTAQKLQRLGNPRISRAIEAIRLVGNCGSYEPTPAQTDKVFAALSAELQRAHAAWKEAKRVATPVEGLL
jgi:hypothetical protein